VFAVIVVLLYALVFATGDHKPTPKLGIDLSGGTTVTLTAQTLNGQPPPADELNQAQQDINNRVNGLGVSGAQVVLNGSNIVITVPGDQGSEAKSLGQTAKLVFRPVIQSVAAGQPAPAPTTTGTPKPSTSSAPTSGATAKSGTATAGATTTAAKPSGQGLPAAGSHQGTSPQDYVAATTAAAPTATPTATPPATPAGAPPAAANSPCWGQTHQQVAKQAPLTTAQQSALIRECISLRQSTNTTAQNAALTALNCGTNYSDPLLGADDPTKPLVACSQDGTAKYLLGPSFLDGTQITSATSGLDPNSAGYDVNVTLKQPGAGIWAKYTAANVGKQAAFVLDTQVVSAPTIQGAIPGGNTQITGNFTQQTAADLANTLRYGSLPLAFKTSNAQTVSPTLGLASLQAGLIAGGIGLALVIVYCLFYYRALGVLTVLSLALSGITIYALLVLLGRWIGYSLDLAGVAGFIISIGITADSFVVFFERLKDEVREGRTFRSAVPRAWVRARRTILASDGVSFLAAVVLYVFAVQDVQGFAFTLGLSTVLDLLIVFLVTHPLVALASRSKLLSRPNVSGLGAVQRAGAAARAAAKAAAPATVKEA
jgi:preprotein translocase subunit SecD